MARKNRDESNEADAALEPVFCPLCKRVIPNDEIDVHGSVALDAGLISSAQAVEHYEIARYGTLKSWAGQLGLDEAVALIDANLQEELETDQLLTQLGEASANPKGAKANKAA